MTVIEAQIPTGTWAVDPVHSTAIFAVRHMGIGTFRGQFRDIDASLQDGVLRGEVAVASVDVQDENLQGHLLSPDFFDAERHPTLTFVTTDVRAAGEQLAIEGDLTIKGVTQSVAATGTLSGPIDLGEGNVKLGVDLETTIDRTAFGLNWNAPLPGGRRMLENDVTLSVHLELARTQG